MEGALDGTFTTDLIGSFSQIILSLVISIFLPEEERYYVLSLWHHMITTVEIQVSTEIYLCCLQMMCRSFQIFS